jgi:ParB-like chromosome segregation protein Spo0J
MVNQSRNIIVKQITDLLPYINNARTHSDEQVSQIAASIKEFGFTNPILITGDGSIIAGHGRVMAAKKLNLSEVPCIELDHLSDTQRKAYILADNKLALNAGWDAQMLMLEMEELKTLEYDLDLIGFNLKEIDEIFNKVELPAELGLMPEDKLDNFLNGDTKILRLAFDEEEFEQAVNCLQELKVKFELEDFSSIVLFLLVEKCKELQ